MNKKMVDGRIRASSGILIGSVLALMTLMMISCSGSNNKEISASGTIETTEITISAKVGGEVMKLLCDEGWTVKKGDTIAIIDRSDLDIQLKQALANADAAEAQHLLAVRGAREEDIAQAEANFKNAGDDLNRMKELMKTNAVTQKQLDDAETRFVVAQQTYEKLKRGSRAEEIQAARARRNQAMAQVESIRKKISDSYITAPMAGVVTQKAIEQGEVVMPNASLFRIAEIKKVHLMIYVTEIELAIVKLGQEAKVTIDAYPDRTFPGTVTYISQIAEFTPKNVQTKDDRTKLVFGVKIQIDNPEQIFKPGMPADATIQIASAP